MPDGGLSRALQPPLPASHTPAPKPPLPAGAHHPSDFHTPRPKRGSGNDTPAATAKATAPVPPASAPAVLRHVAAVGDNTEHHVHDGVGAEYGQVLHLKNSSAHGTEVQHGAPAATGNTAIVHATSHTAMDKLPSTTQQQPAVEVQVAGGAGHGEVLDTTDGPAGPASAANVPNFPESAAPDTLLGCSLPTGQAVVGEHDGSGCGHATASGQLSRWPAAAAAGSSTNMQALAGLQDNMQPASTSVVQVSASARALGSVSAARLHHSSSAPGPSIAATGMGATTHDVHAGIPVGGGVHTLLQPSSAAASGSSQQLNTPQQ